MVSMYDRMVTAKIASPARKLKNVYSHLVLLPKNTQVGPPRASYPQRLAGVHRCFDPSFEMPHVLGTKASLATDVADDVQRGFRARTLIFQPP